MSETTKKKKQQHTEEVKFVGRFVSHRKGFGFVEVEGQTEDFYVPEKKVHNAFHGDTVEVTLLPKQKGKRQEVEVTQVIMHGMTQIVGTFEKCKSFGFVTPDLDKLPADIFIPLADCKNAVNGHKVVVEITDYGQGRSRSPEGKVVEILGHINDPGVDIASIVRGFELPEGFPEKVLEQAQRVAKPVSEADKLGRMDFTHVPMVTIDGEDAKDLDDAVSLTVEDGIYHLGVHIADVTNYVQESSALDKEALKRGTSVYLVDRVIPMLPHTLSNGICSLNAKEERLALSCLMDFDSQGELVDYKITESVICVDERMNYTDVALLLKNRQESVNGASHKDDTPILDTDSNEETVQKQDTTTTTYEHKGIKKQQREAEKIAQLLNKYEYLLPMFYDMADLSKILREKRRKRGAVDFGFDECKIILNKHGKPVDIRPYERTDAHMLIEDFMLAANETVASHFYWLEAPFVYRSHAKPDPEKMKKLETFLHNMGYYLKVSGDGVHPKEFQKLLEKIKDTPEENLISRLTLRSMNQAKYTTECSGHFGLACTYYCHFTSPIRRYPDLQIHRIIKDSLRGRLDERKIRHYHDILSKVAEDSSKLERRAEQAERETDKCKKAQYMADHIGAEYDGVVSGLTGWGMYVELPNTVEGMVPISKLPSDYYEYDDKKMEIYGVHHGRSFKLGQKVHVWVNQVDLLAYTIDFALDLEDNT